MTQANHLIIQATVKNGKEDRLKNVLGDATQQVQSEEGTLDWRWARQNDGNQVYTSELYASPQAFVDHYNHAKQVGALDAIMECIDMKECHWIGSTTPEAKEILDGFKATYMKQIGGFSRIPQLAAQPIVR